MPGPGHYNWAENKSGSNQKSVTLGLTAPRFGHLKEVGRVGPGSYEQPSQWRGGCRFGTEERSRSPVREAPGPGGYELPSYVANLPAYARSKF